MQPDQICLSNDFGQPRVLLQLIGDREAMRQQLGREFFRDEKGCYDRRHTALEAAAKFEVHRSGAGSIDPIHRIGENRGLGCSRQPRAWHPRCRSVLRFTSFPAELPWGRLGGALDI